MKVNLDSDVVFYNGFVYTADKKRSRVQALAVKGDKIIYVGSDAGVKEYISDQTRIYDLKGKMLLPGFIDSHCHPAVGAYGLSESSVDLYDCTSVEDYLDRVYHFAVENPKQEVIYGIGWGHLKFDRKGPRKEMLDKIIPDRLVCLFSDSLHSVWVNSKTLEYLSLTKDSPDPPGGVIEKDDITLEPTGTLREKARDIAMHNLPHLSVEQYKESISRHMEYAKQYGITTACDAWTYLGGNDIEAYRQLDREEKLTVRYMAMIRLPEESKEKAIGMLPEIKKLKGTANGRRFSISAVKVFVDGIIEEVSAYLGNPYNDRPDTRADTMWPSHADLEEIITAYDKEKFQIHGHVIGDSAFKVYLNCIEAAYRKNGRRDARHTAAHIQLAQQSDIIRCGELDVMSVSNSFWFTKDQEGYFDRFGLEAIGSERANRQYPMKSLFKAGVNVSNASDFPISSPNPLEGIEMGITRRYIGYPEECTLWKEESVDVEQMIETVTANAAYANFLEDVTGSLEVGKKADIVVLDQNLLEIAPEEIHNVGVLLTMLEGAVVFERQL